MSLFIIYLTCLIAGVFLVFNVGKAKTTVQIIVSHIYIMMTIFGLVGTILTVTIWITKGAQ